MSWLDQLIGKLTIAQAQTLYQFLKLSEQGDRHLRMKAEGCDWVTIQWIGYTSEDKATHCRIETDHVDIADFVLTVRQAEAVKIALRYELSRAFDKPDRTIFRRN